MKFLCDACKTKYQIDDDKVAGKTVRMKCRKCGHLIEIRTSGATSSPSTPPPSLAPAGLNASSPVSKRSHTVPPPPSSAVKTPLRAPAKPAGPASPSSPSLAGPSAAASAALTPAASATAPTGPGAPRKPAAVRPLGAGAAGTATSQIRIQNPLNPSTQTMSRPGVAPLQGRAPAAPPAPRPGAARPPTRPEGFRPAGAATSPNEANGGSGVLQDAITASAAALESLDGAVAAPHQWFVAIDGSPVGPLPLDQLKPHVAAGKMTGDSLAWREGLGDWKKAAEISDLAVLFGRPAAAGRPLSGVQARSGGVPNLAADDGDYDAHDAATKMEQVPDELVRAARAALGEPFAAAPSPFMADGFQPNADPFAPTPFVAPGHHPFELAGAATASGIGAGLNGGGAFHAGAEPLTAAAEAMPAAAPNMGYANAGAAGPTYEDPQAATHHKKGPPWIPIALIATAVAFGCTAAIVLFLQKPQKVVAADPAPSGQPSVAVQAPHPSEAHVPPPEASTAVVAEVDPKIASAGTPNKGSSGGSKTPAPGASSSAADLSKLLGGGGAAGGPTAATGGGGGGGGGSLSQQQIERTVQSYMPGVKRGCWDSSTAQTGDVRAAIVIGASGAVSNVTTQSSDSALAHCIETKVRGWKFPPPGGSQTVNVPFKFLRQ